MDFSLTEAQRELAALTRRILDDRVDARALGRHGSGGFDRELWRELAGAGVVEAALGEPAGGGFGLLEQCAVLIEIGRAVAPLPYLPTITMAAAALAEFGDDGLLDRWMAPLLRGEKVLAVALPDTGTPCGFTATRTAGGWRVSGAQTAVAFGAFADGFVVPAETTAGTGVFVLGHDQVRTDSQSTIDHADAALVQAFDAPAVPLGEPGTGVGEWLRLRGTTGLCALQLGVVESALHRTAEYARQRKQFDHPIAAFQAVRQRLADAYLDVEAVRLTLWQAAWRLVEDGPSAAVEVATAKYWAAEAGHRVAHTAVHLHGGVGIDVDYPLHRYFVAAKRIEFALGGATAQLRTLGDLLATEPA
ncbi:MAG TPA: acyl-CoA dehydrogenase family protein [Amycolatopsis sp.]|jgi:alkylation response protein AidB-like acyl-CoA dehydrogenase|nr:acyl-CoA dehydrogenase family protein [Amycolatopsis sp.]